MQTQIPLVDLKTQYRGLKGELLQAISTVLEGMNLIPGENVSALEKEFAHYCGSSYAVGVGSGTDALALVLRSWDITQGDEVITVSHTFFATAEAIMMTGARPVFVDIDPETYAIDPAMVERAITPHTKAIIPVHLYGHPADMAPILSLAKSYNLKVLEDACQAHGAFYQGKRVGTIGHAGAFSFYVSKNLGAYGEGGMITTDDEEVASKVRMLRDHGSVEKYKHVLTGSNSRLDEIQAAILRVKLPHLDEWNASRRSNAERYTRLLKDTSVRTPVERPGCRHVYHLYVIETSHRDELKAWLHDKGVGTGIHYPIPIHEQLPLQGYGYRPGSLPVTESLAKRILSLPMYPELTEEQVNYVAQCVDDFHAQKARAGRRATESTMQTALAGRKG